MEFDATFIIAVISFIVFVFIMNKIFYAPVLKVMQERQDFVEKNYTFAKKTNEDSQQKEDFYAEELTKARDEARGKISQQARLYKEERSKEILNYKNDLYKDVAVKKDELKQSALDAKETLKDSVVDIAKEISSKILGENINVDGIKDIPIIED